MLVDPCLTCRQSASTALSGPVWSSVLCGENKGRSLFSALVCSRHLLSGSEGPRASGLGLVWGDFSPKCLSNLMQIPWSSGFIDVEAVRNTTGVLHCFRSGRSPVMALSTGEEDLPNASCRTTWNTGSRTGET